jgi:hypothetical protein
MEKALVRQASEYCSRSNGKDTLLTERQVVADARRRLSYLSRTRRTLQESCRDKARAITAAENRMVDARFRRLNDARDVIGDASSLSGP